jgi:hypothetical protein
VDPRSRQENATNQVEHFQAKWIPVRVKKMRQTKEPLPAHGKKEASLAASLLRDTSIHAY